MIKSTEILLIGHYANKLSIPIWLKDTDRLKELIEGVAKTAYRIAWDDIGSRSRAQKTALWYILIGQKSMLCSLYKTEPDNKRYMICCKIISLKIDGWKQQIRMQWFLFLKRTLKLE